MSAFVGPDVAFAPGTRTFSRRTVKKLPQDEAAAARAYADAIVEEQARAAGGGASGDEEDEDDDMETTAVQNMRENRTDIHRDVQSRIHPLMSAKHTKRALLRRYACHINIHDDGLGPQQKRVCEIVACAAVEMRTELTALHGCQVAVQTKDAMVMACVQDDSGSQLEIAFRAHHASFKMGGQFTDILTAVLGAVYGLHDAEALAALAAAGDDWVDIPSGMLASPIGKEHPGSPWAPVRR